MAKENVIQAASQVHYRFQYAVKFICYGPQGKPEGLVPGHYQTAVNIHNPRHSSNPPITFRSKLASPGQISPWRDAQSLKEDAVAHINCSDLKNYRIKALSGFEGFLVIESDYRLDVVAVYTAAPITGGQVSTMDVERIPGRRITS